MPDYYTPEQRRSYNLKYLYGITLSEFNQILDEQGGRCAVCQTLAADSNKSFQVDHDHMCCPQTKSCGKCVRGLICHKCNSALGMVNDDAERLEALARYVRRHRSRLTF